MRIACFSLFSIFLILNKFLFALNNPILTKYVWTSDETKASERNSTESPKLPLKKQDKAVNDVSKVNKSKYIWKGNEGKTRRIIKEELKDVAKIAKTESVIIVESVFSNMLPLSQNQSSEASHSFVRSSIHSVKG